MKPFRLGIRSKVLLLLTGLLVAIFGAATLYFVQSTVRSLRQNLTGEAQSFAELATQPIGKTFLLYRDSGTVKIDQQVERFTSLNQNIANVAIYDYNGQLVYQQKNTTLPSITPQQAASFNREYIDAADGRLIGVIQPFIEDNGIHRYGILYVISNNQIDKSIHDGVVLILILAVVALLLLSLVLFFAMNQLLLKPISRLSEGALQISAGKLDIKIKEERHDEIGDLAHSVSTMADSLKADIVKLREVDELKSEFMMITSHNLRTPLTIINGYLDTMQSMPLTAEIKKMVDTIAANSTRLGALAEDILTISQIEAGQKISVTPEEVDLSKLTNQIAIEYALLAEKHQLAFSYKVPKTALIVLASAPQLRQAIWNLLDNALKFTKAGGRVDLIVRQSSGKALIQVTDTGIGISAEEQTKLFTKFHRGTSTLQYDYEGIGIGLYISRLLVREFGGDINVESQLGKGSAFTISLPIKT